VVEAAGRTKIAIVGAGSVGATLAQACLIRGAAKTIALYDVDAGPARARRGGARRDIPSRGGAAEEIIRGKGATNYAIGLAAARIVEAVLYDEHRVLPVSSLLAGLAGISDVCLSVPAVVDRTGVQGVLPVPMSDGEIEGLRRSADTIRGVIRKLGI